MGRLTEKEKHVEHNEISADIWAEYDDGELERITAMIKVDGWPVTWSLTHKNNHDYIELWNDIRGLTKDWKLAVMLIQPEFMLKFRKEIDRLTEGR